MPTLSEDMLTVYRHGLRLGGAAADDESGLVDDLRALLRRDWDVRVLDAWAFARRNKKAVTSTRYYYGEACMVWEVLLQEHGSKSRRFEGQTSAHESDPDTARHAAALAVFPTLSAEKQAKLGECP